MGRKKKRNTFAALKQVALENRNKKISQPQTSLQSQPQSSHSTAIQSYPQSPHSTTIHSSPCHPESLTSETQLSISPSLTSTTSFPSAWETLTPHSRSPISHRITSTTPTTSIPSSVDLTTLTSDISSRKRVASNEDFSQWSIFHRIKRQQNAESSRRNKRLTKKVNAGEQHVNVVPCDKPVPIEHIELLTKRAVYFPKTRRNPPIPRPKLKSDDRTKEQILHNAVKSLPRSASVRLTPTLWLVQATRADGHLRKQFFHVYATEHAVTNDDTEEEEVVINEKEQVGNKDEDGEQVVAKNDGTEEIRLEFFCQCSLGRNCIHIKLAKTYMQWKPISMEVQLVYKLGDMLSIGEGLVVGKVLGVGAGLSFIMGNMVLYATYTSQ